MHECIQGKSERGQNYQEEYGNGEFRFRITNSFGKRSVHTGSASAETSFDRCCQSNCLPAMSEGRDDVDRRAQNAAEGGRLAVPAPDERMQRIAQKLSRHAPDTGMILKIDSNWSRFFDHQSSLDADFGIRIATNSCTNQARTRACRDFRLVIVGQ